MIEKAPSLFTSDKLNSCNSHSCRNVIRKDENGASCVLQAGFGQSGSSLSQNETCAKERERWIDRYIDRERERERVQHADKYRSLGCSTCRERDYLAGKRGRMPRRGLFGEMRESRRATLSLGTTRRRELVHLDRYLDKN